MKILMVGDIVGSPGRKIFARVAAKMKASGEVDFIVANAENSAAGRGVNARLAGELLDAGADVLTLGDHTWDQKDIQGFFQTEQRVIRPLNFASGCPGKGFVTVQSAFGPVTVINAIGRVFMNPYDSPFDAIDRVLSEHDLGNIILVDFHAEATSEKVVLGRHLEGRVSAVVGTHTHVQTSDEKILCDHTAYITDLGMTGPSDSSIGRDLEQCKQILMKGMPAPFKVGKEGVVLEGVIVDVDRSSGKARSIKRVREHLQTEE